MPAQQAPKERIEIRPQKGPQEAFLSSPADIAIYGGAAGGGKMLSIDTPIPTPDGWRQMGDLREGDTVFDERGAPCRVTHAHPITVAQSAYRVVFDDGSSIEACGEHLWLTLDAKELVQLSRRTPEFRAQRRARRPSRVSGNKSDAFTRSLVERNKRNPTNSKPAPVGSVRTTSEIASTLLTDTGRRNHAIPVASPLMCPGSVLPLDPYLLGVWLGDGTSVRGEITTADPEIADAFADGGFVVRKSTSAQYRYGILGLHRVLRTMGLMGNKHVPPQYLRGAAWQRLALLQGLMDTDGYASEEGRSEFTTTSPALRDAAHELIVSLGWKASVTEGRAMLRGRDCGPKWRINFTPSDAVFRLTRKRERQRLSTRRTTRFRYVVSCEPIGPRPMRCITVDSPSRLYLAGRGMVPTHNSYALTLEPLRHAGVKGFSAIVFRRKGPQLLGAGSIWEEQKGVYPHFGAKSREAPRLEWRFPSGARVELSHLQHERDVQDHQSKQYALIIFDELTQFTERQFWYLVSRNRSVCGVRPYIRAATNPDPDSFVRKLIDWWIGPDGFPILERSGVIRWVARVNEELVWGDTKEELLEQHPSALPLSLTFIAAKLDDNPALMAKDPGYRAKLMNLPRVERERLLGGNWDVRAAAGMYFRRANFTIVDTPPAEITRCIRWWDKAATEPSPANPDPDWTAGVKMAKLKDGQIIVLHVKRDRGAPGKVDAWMKAAAEADGVAVAVGAFQDPGQAGVVDREHIRRVIGRPIVVMRPTNDKVTVAGPFSAHADTQGVLLLRGEWNEAYILEHENFDGDPKKKDDQVDASAAAFIHLSKGGLVHV